MTRPLLRIRSYTILFSPRLGKVLLHVARLVNSSIRIVIASFDKSWMRPQLIELRGELANCRIELFLGIRSAGNVMSCTQPCAFADQHIQIVFIGLDYLKF